MDFGIYFLLWLGFAPALGRTFATENLWICGTIKKREWVGENTSYFSQSLILFQFVNFEALARSWTHKYLKELCFTSVARFIPLGALSALSPPWLGGFLVIHLIITTGNYYSLNLAQNRRSSWNIIHFINIFTSSLFSFVEFSTSKEKEWKITYLIVK